MKKQFLADGSWFDLDRAHKFDATTAVFYETCIGGWVRSDPAGTAWTQATEQAAYTALKTVNSPDLAKKVWDVTDEEV